MKFSTATALAVYLSGGVLAAPAKDSTDVASMKMKATRDTSRIEATQHDKKPGARFAEDDDMQADAEMMGQTGDTAEGAVNNADPEGMVMRREVMRASNAHAAEGRSQQTGQKSKRGYGYPYGGYPSYPPHYPAPAPSFPATYASILQPVGTTNLKARDVQSSDDAQAHQMWAANPANNRMVETKNFLAARAESNANAAAQASQDDTIVPVYAPILTPLGQPPVPYPGMYRRDVNSKSAENGASQMERQPVWNKMAAGNERLVARAESADAKADVFTPVYAPILTPLGQPPVPGYPVYRRDESATHGMDHVEQAERQPVWNKMTAEGARLVARGESVQAGQANEAKAAPTNEKVFTPVLAPVLQPLGGPAYGSEAYGPQAYGPHGYYRRDENGPEVADDEQLMDDSAADDTMNSADDKLVARNEAAAAGAANNAEGVPTNEKVFMPTYASLLQPVGETWVKRDEMAGQAGQANAKMITARAEQAAAGSAGKESSDVFMPTLAPILQPVGETWIKRDTETDSAGHNAIVARGQSAQAAPAQGAGVAPPTAMNRVALVAANQAASVPVSAKFRMANQGRPVAYAKLYQSAQTKNSSGVSK